MGYAVFSRICLKYKQTEEALKYTDKIGAMDDRFDVLLEAGSFRKASEVAYKMKDPERLEAVSLSI